MFFQNATIHHDCQPCIERPQSRILVDHSLLQPHTSSADANRFIHMLPRFFAPPKYVHKINLLEHVFKLPVSLLAEHAGLVRVHRYDSIAV